MKALKKFLDAGGKLVRPGQDVSGQYEKPVLDHYLRLGMVGSAAVPDESKPAAPGENKGDGGQAGRKKKSQDEADKAD